MILDKIIASTRERVQRSKEARPYETVKLLAQESLPPSAAPFRFEQALQTDDIAFICEVKKASPSKGVIAQDFPYVQIATEYETAGANAISVLTEPDFFLGDPRYLSEIKRQVTIPVLRKDFILDAYQLYESRLLGADAILLICSVLDTDTIKRYIEIADQLSLSCLVEAHNAQEVQSAVDAGARIIGVNNRDLKTFAVDLNNSIALRTLVPSHITFVSESGISTPDEINRLREHGTNAVLIGEQLMVSDNKKKSLDRLRGRSLDGSR